MYDYANILFTGKKCNLRCHECIGSNPKLQSLPYNLDIFPFAADKKYAFVFGHEIRGVQQEIVDISDLSIDIPQFGTKHSLNISVCVGIVLWEVFKSQRLGKKEGRP